MNQTELDDVVRRLALVFARRRVQHALIGGLAVGLRSRPRATKDADFIIQVPALSFAGLLEDLVAEGFGIDVMAAIRQWFTATGSLRSCTGRYALTGFNRCFRSMQTY